MPFLGSEIIVDNRPQKFPSVVKIILFVVQNVMMVNIFLRFHLKLVPNMPLALDM